MRERIMYIYTGPDRFSAWLGLVGGFWGPAGVLCMHKFRPTGPELILAALKAEIKITNIFPLRVRAGIGPKTAIS